MKRGPRTSHNASKTHCPRGHPYDEANTIRLKSGGRWCRQCEKDRAIERSTGYLVPGYRDKTCPICGAGYFVSVAIHASKAHGQKVTGHPSHWGDERERAAVFGWDKGEVLRRRRRWAAAMLEEQAKGGAYVQRLAKRWRIPRGAATSRIARLVAEGLVTRTYPVGGHHRKTAAACGRGHPWTPKSTRIDRTGGRQCRVCDQIRSRRGTPRLPVGPEPASRGPWTSTEIAAYFGITPRQLWSLRFKGALPPAKRIGGCLFWDPAVVRRWVRRQSGPR